MRYFQREESASYPGKFLLKPIHENFHLDYTEGSFNVICARVMGLTYAQYLRMCRDKYGAEIIGKGSKFPVAYFTLSQKSNELLEELNVRAKFIIWEREHPDFEEHEQSVKRKLPKFYNEVINNVYNS